MDGASRRLLALALAAAAVSTAHADVTVGAAPPRENDKLYVTVEVRGQFSARGSLDVNLINAPATGGPREPPPLPVSPAELARLNRELPAAIDEALRDVRLTKISGAMGGEIRPLVRERDGDRFFALTVEASPDNGLGGHYGGLDLATRLRSLHRKEELHNFGFSTVKGDLRRALHIALDQSLHDFYAVLARPLGEVDLVFDTANLRPDQRAALLDRVAACAAQLAAPVDHQPGPPDGTHVVRKIWFRVGRWDPKETEESWVSRYESLLPSIATVGKGQGCTQGTPLEKLMARAHQEGPRLVVQFGPQSL